MKKRCSWASGDELNIRYHDKEWGVPIHDDKILFESLCLEGQQAGLSWIIVLKKRDNYRNAFYNFDVEKISKMKDRDIFMLLSNDGLIKNKLKLFSIRNNAIEFIKIQREFKSFDNYIWSFTENKTIKSKLQNTLEISDKVLLSNNISKDLKKRNFKFIGPKICYAFLQAIGIINDHSEDCFRYNEIKKLYNIQK
tara:strand:- start:6505 stop:7089 length:585 start_codon:yes stop_codon:yes gene_type:complete